MASWEWLVVAMVAFGVLQLLALRYALRGEGADAVGGTPYAVDADRLEPEDAPEGVRVCPNCGGENRAGFTYCQHCLGLIGR